MVSPRETAEEQLLRMIEGPQGSGAPSTPSGASGSGRPSPKRPAASLQDVLSWRWRRLFPRRTHANTDAFLWNLKLTQQIMWVVLFALSAYVAYDLVTVQPKPRRHAVSAPVSSAPAPDSVPAHIKELRPLSEYLSVVMQRNPFTGAIAGLAPVVKTAKRRLQEMIGGLSIVGIDRGPNPVALIEDKEGQRTYIVKAGDRIKEMEVQKIDANGVVLSYEGEQIVLR